MKTPWYKTAFRRNVIDMHITDDDPAFLSKFDADRYVDLLVKSQAQSAVVYAHSHAGLCNFPTKVGQMHRGLHGRNIFGEVVERCHQRGIGVQAYMSLVYDCWAYNNHPDWRIIKWNDEGNGKGNRYGVCCPNSPYREYVRGLVTELCSQFDFEGVRFDMTFWPNVCYCQHCQRRYAEEIGGEIPRIVNWENPVWVAFQRRREAWLTEFAALATVTVKKFKPKASVEHQASTFVSGPWVCGVAAALIDQNDFLQGDFYGDALQGSFARKFFSNATPNQPYGFETSFCIDIGNHTAMKSHELLEAKACAAIADNGAFIFIDAIDPAGTLNPKVYDRMEQIFRMTRRYDPFRGGERCQDVAIYLSLESKLNPGDNGKKIGEVNPWGGFGPHMDAALSAARSLISHHIPFGVISRRNLGELSRHRVLILPNVLMMDREECDATRAWVKKGGRLYASKNTSILANDGQRQKDFMLADLFGVSYEGVTEEGFTYISPVEGHGDLFPDYSAAYPAGYYCAQFRVKPVGNIEVLGTLTLPYEAKQDTRFFASIHSNPPGRPTESPSIVLHKFGKGQVIYAAGELESSNEHRGSFVRLIRMLLPTPSFETDAPGAVEVTMYHQPKEKRYILNLLNFQKDLPNIPINGIKVRVRTGLRKFKRAVLLPNGKSLKSMKKNDMIEIAVPRLNTFQMIAVEYR